MKALIGKDFRAYTLLMFGMLIIMVLYSYLCLRLNAIKGLLGLLTVMMPSFISLIVYLGDHQVHPYLISLPISRKTFVISKYLSTAIFSFMIIGLCVLIMYLLSSSYTDAKLQFEQLMTLEGLIFLITPATLIVSVCYPLLFRFGLKIGVRIIMGSFALSYGMGMVAVENWIQSRYLVAGGGIFNAYMGVVNHIKMDSVFYLGILLSLCTLYLISIALSVWAVRGKDII